MRGVGRGSRGRGILPPEPQVFYVGQERNDGGEGRWRRDDGGRMMEEGRWRMMGRGAPSLPRKPHSRRDIGKKLEPGASASESFHPGSRPRISPRGASWQEKAVERHARIALLV